MKAVMVSVPPMKPIQVAPLRPKREAWESGDSPAAPIHAAPMISSLEKKPANGGNPAMASVAMPMVAKVTGR